MSLARLSGKYALINGASRGIGLAIAQTFATHGANCCLIGRQNETLQEALGSLQRSAEQKHTTYTMDVGDVDAWETLCKSTGSIDLLVNAAGITHYSLLPRTPVSIIDSVVQTNLLGTIYASKAATRVMLAKKQPGCIINVSSALAHRGGSGSSVYAASKAGVLGFTRALAEELGPRDIRCNAIAPGYIDTDMLSGMSESLKGQVAAKASVGRIGTVEEVADAALFLATNSFANGITLTLDGGLTYP